MMDPNRTLLALRDALDERLSALPVEQEAQPGDVDDLVAGLGLLMAQQAQTREMAAMRQAPPRQRPAVLALMRPAEPHWTIWVKLPEGHKPGAPLRPQTLNLPDRTYLLHAGANYVAATAWDGGIPDELEAPYRSGGLAVYGPGEKLRETESFLLLWSRARSVAFGIDRIQLEHQAAAKAAFEPEIVRILQKIPSASGEMFDSIKKLHAVFGPQPKYTGEKNTPAAQQRRAQAAARAKAIAAGEDPHEPEIIASFAPGAQQQTLAVNSFGHMQSKAAP